MHVRPVSLVALLLAVVFAGCVGIEPPEVGLVEDPDGSVLSYLFPETVTGMEHVRQMEFTLGDGTAFDMVGNGLFVHEGLAYVSGSNLVILDLRDDPSAPEVLAIVEDTPSRDVDIMVHPDGRIYAMLSGAPGIVVVDVTEPSAPEVVHRLPIGYHNLVVVPDTTIVYNSRSVYTGEGVKPPEQSPRRPEVGADVLTKGGLVDVIDFANVTAPVVEEFRLRGPTMLGTPKVGTAPACHDITVYPEAGRAYCAGVTETQVWDITTPAEPKILQIVHNPGTNIHHAAWPAKDHTLLVIGDELGGAAVAPGCVVADQAYGGLWFVDISDLSDPKPVGWYAPREQTRQNISCTSHFGGFVEDTQIMVMGWYTAGTVLIDITDPTDVKEIAQFADATDTWESRYYAGHVYTGDMARGVDVLTLVGDGAVTKTIQVR
ncbi:MAG: hypothetical protein KY455_01710 [Euryarchaeota archaeon]|nr:hypothetical protein [Euryarchaeota archaeon]